MYIKIHGSMSHNCSSVSSPAMTLVKEELAAKGFEGCEA